MAGRSHVDVSERRLRPVYDCLDGGNNKKAVQEADKVLKKQKDCLCAKVLKGLALVRLGRQADANILLEEVIGRNPTDDSTLSALTICFKELQTVEKIVTVYENAHQVLPDNEEILTSLFMAYVRVGDYRKQQQVALKLNKLQPHKNPYYFWGVMSVVLQAQENSKLAKTIFLPLARKMTEKYVNDDRVDAEAEVFLYLMILDMLGDHETALKVIQGPLAAKITSNHSFKSVKEVELLTKLDRWPDVNAAYRKLLIESPDNWQYYTHYFTSFFTLMDQGWTKDFTDGGDPVDCKVSSVQWFLDEQISKRETKHLLRGPYLAKMEFYKQLSQREDSATADMCLYDMLKDYFEKFSSKHCCFSDMKPYVRLLDKEQSSKLTEDLLQMTNLLDKDGMMQLAADAKQVQSHLSGLQLSRYLDQHSGLSVDDRMNLAHQLAARHEDALQFGKDLLSTDLQHGDSYLLMSVHIFAELWRETGDDNFLWRMVVLLERALKSSPSNFQMKILLINFYCILGAFGPCPLIYDSMEIKNVQNDTLGYLISNHVCRLGNLTSASIVYGNMLRFFTVNHKEITEQLTTSYKFGSFCKIIEFINFRERLQNSLQYAIATSERMLIDLTIEAESLQDTDDALAYLSIDPANDKTNWEELTDNRDMSFLLSWDPPSRCIIQEVKQTSFNEEKAWLHMRNLLLRSLAAAVLMSKHGCEGGVAVNGNSNNTAKVLADLSSEFDGVVKKSAVYSDPIEYPIQGPFRTRISWYLKDGHASLYTDMLRLVQYVAELEDRGDNCDKDMEHRMASIPQRLIDIMTKAQSCIQTEDKSKRQFHAELLERLVLVAESISYLTVLTAACYRLLKPIKAAILKIRKKKKESNTEMPAIFTSYKSLVSGLESAAKQLLEAFQQTHPTTVPDISVLSLDSTCPFSQELCIIEQDVVKKVETSYQETTKEMAEYVNKKVKFLGSIHLS